MAHGQGGKSMSEFLKDFFEAIEKQEKIDNLIAQDNPEAVANLLKTHIQ